MKIPGDTAEEQARILYENSDQTAAEVCQSVGIGRRALFSHLAQRRVGTIMPE